MYKISLKNNIIVTTVALIIYLVIGVNNSYANDTQKINRLMKFAMETQQVDLSTKLTEKEKVAKLDQVHGRYSSFISNISSPSRDLEIQILLVEATIQSLKASSSRNMDGLTYAKQAKKALDKILKLDPKGFNGVAISMLGSLYASLPSWSISFGNKKKGKNYC